jgi:hypothetical protein
MFLIFHCFKIIISDIKKRMNQLLFKVFLIMIAVATFESRPHFENRVVGEALPNEKESIKGKPLSGNDSLKNEEHLAHKTNIRYKSNLGINSNDANTK